MNRTIVFLWCGLFFAGCSRPESGRTFSEKDLMPRESKQASGAQFPVPGEPGQVVPLPLEADHAPGMPMPAAPPSGSLPGPVVEAPQEEAPVQEIREKEPEGRKNPFLREAEESLFESTKDRLPITYLNLSAVFYAPGESVAVIDGQFYKEGDTVDNKRIVSIFPEEVVLKDAQSVYVLQLQGILKPEEAP